MKALHELYSTHTISGGQRSSRQSRSTPPLAEHRPRQTRSSAAVQHGTSHPAFSWDWQPGLYSER